MSAVTNRVKIWNTFFKLAWSEAKSLYETSHGKKNAKKFNPLGGTVPEQEFHTLATLALCCLAIEARANHLIEEMLEEGKASKDEAEAARRLRTRDKWFFLPKLAGTRKKLDSNKRPHQSIAQICALRNYLIHVNYDQLKRKLPKPNTMLSYFKGFVEAMDDMNVVLKPVRKPRQKVLKIGSFT